MMSSIQYSASTISCGLFSKTGICRKSSRLSLLIKAELEKLAPAPPQLLRMIPAAAAATVPYAATAQPAEPPDFTGLAEAIARAVANLGDQGRNDEPIIRVYLDGKQLSDAVTRYQRSAQRMYGG